ncbi:hypothetical protein HII36_01425 [Nonomuraea sp. NN258]|uniref:hypothetical protein n=1 Tax=Nonomuraea antri TaxID=2730852 RepID=UPI001568A9EF|nr:hypothetical protein [Nonomuraea antri]NRQ30506.1 hypothetical protein [Nonomuraea antri]
MTEQDLRELLDRDSAEAPRGGVSLADVDRRVGRIRRGRVRALGSVTLAALAVVAVANLPRTETARAPEDVWTGVMARPSASGYHPGLPITYAYSVAGHRQSITFDTTAGPISFAMFCPADGYALIWLNERFVADGPCGPTKLAPPRWMGEAVAQSGVNEVVAAVVPAAEAGTGPMTGARAEQVLARITSYPATWSLAVMRGAPRTCSTVVMLDPKSGKVDHADICPSVTPVATMTPAATVAGRPPNS